MDTYRLTRDVYSESVDIRGRAFSEGWLPCGTVVCQFPDNDVSPWTGSPRANHGNGQMVKVVRNADGTEPAVLCRELLLDVRNLEDVAVLLATEVVAK